MAWMAWNPHGPILLCFELVAFMTRGKSNTLSETRVSGFVSALGDTCVNSSVGLEWARDTTSILKVMVTVPCILVLSFYQCCIVSESAFMYGVTRASVLHVYYSRVTCHQCVSCNAATDTFNAVRSFPCNTFCFKHFTSKCHTFLVRKWFITFPMIPSRPHVYSHMSGRDWTISSYLKVCQTRN